MAVNVPKVPKPQFDWLSDMLNPNSYKKQPNVIEEVILSHGIAISKSTSFLKAYPTKTNQIFSFFQKNPQLVS